MTELLKGHAVDPDTTKLDVECCLMDAEDSWRARIYETVTVDARGNYEITVLDAIARGNVEIALKGILVFEAQKTV